MLTIFIVNDHSQCQEKYRLKRRKKIETWIYSVQEKPEVPTFALAMLLIGLIQGLANFWSLRERGHWLNEIIR